MSNRGSRNFFAQVFRFAYFTVSAFGLVWMLAQYGQVNFVSAMILLPAFGYLALHLISLINLVKKDKFLVGSSIDVLSLGTQKFIHRVGLLLPVPILLYMSGFAYCVGTYNVSDEASYNRVVAFSGCENAAFGKSVIWSYLPKVPVQAVEEAPPAVAEDPSFVRNDVDFKPYMDDMSVAMKRVWNPPPATESHQVKVLFWVQKDGTITSASISKHAPSKEADRAALEAVRKASPLKPLPPGSPEKIDVEFTFSYNVFIEKEQTVSSGIQPDPIAN
ncbi:MAG: energy transducer TonB [Candidatus Melainabacteria bacterium]|jgi:TonB family protein|nr:energy transducer TonB [Candidatus Melainabacteria bacterium]